MNRLRLFNCIILLFSGLTVVNNCSAQDEVDQDFEGADIDTVQTNSVRYVTLKKGYRLGNGITFRSGSSSFQISPTLQTLFETNTTQDNLSKLNTGASIPRSRITLISNLFDPRFSLVARVNLSASNQSTTTGNRSFNTALQEAYFEYRHNSKHVFNVGLRADYIDSRETRFQGENLGFVTRSAVSSTFDAIFDYGIRYKGTYRLVGKHLLRPYFSVTSGDSRSSLQKNFGGFKYGARLDYLPFDKFSQGGEFYMDDLAREIKPKLVLGLVYSYNDGATSAMGTNGGRWLYGNANQKIILPDYSKWIADFMFKYRGFYSLGSFVTTKATVPSNIAGEFRLNGTFNQYSTSQTPDQTKNLVLSRLNLGSGFNIQGGYILSSDIAFGIRYSSVKNNEHSASFGDYNRFYTLVISKYILDHNLKIQGQLGFDELRTPLKTPDSKGNYNAQIMATIQL